MRYLFALLLFCSNVAADDLNSSYYSEGVNYTLNGRRISDTPSPQEKGHAIVCGLKSDDSFLSIRAKPSFTSKEIIKLNNFMIVNLTGEFDESLKWAKIDYFIIAADKLGAEWPKLSQQIIPLNGWVYVLYLCDFYDHPTTE